MQAGDSTHTTTNIRRCTCEPLLVQHVNDFAGGAPLTNTVQRGAVCEPRVVLGHFSRLATQVVQNVHLKLKLSVDAVPVLNNLVLVGAQPNNDPDRQMQQRAQCLLNAAVASLAIGRYDDSASLALGPQPRRLLLHALHDLQNAIVSRLTRTLRNGGETTHTWRICAQSGVNPRGPQASTDSKARISDSGSAVVPQCIVWSPPEGGLRNLNSVGADMYAAMRACHRSASPSSCHRVQPTNASVPAFCSRTCPSPLCIDPELSMIQIRSGNSSTDASIASCIPAGSSVVRRKLSRWARVVRADEACPSMASVSEISRWSGAPTVGV